MPLGHLRTQHLFIDCKVWFKVFFYYYVLEEYVNAIAAYFPLYDHLNLWRVILQSSDTVLRTDNDSYLPQVLP